MGCNFLRTAGNRPAEAWRAVTGAPAATQRGLHRRAAENRTPRGLRTYRYVRAAHGLQLSADCGARAQRLSVQHVARAAGGRVQTAATGPAPVGPRRKPHPSGRPHVPVHASGPQGVTFCAAPARPNPSLEPAPDADAARARGPAERAGAAAAAAGVATAAEAAPEPSAVAAAAHGPAQEAVDQDAAEYRARGR